MDLSVHSLVLVAAAAALAPLCASLLARWIAIPLVVFEIAFGIVLGPQVAGWIDNDQYVEFLATLGLAMLFLLAGYEIDFQAIRGRPLRLSALAWLGSLVIGMVLGVLLTPTVAAGVMVGICLTSTALGTIMPMLRDAGELQTPFGNSMLAIGAVGEFGPLVAIALLLSGRSPARAGLILVAFVVLIAVSVFIALRYEHLRVHRLIETTLHTSGQFAVRLVILILAVLTGLATAFGLDMLLGAFAAGVLISILLRSADAGATAMVEAKLDAVGFGFLVPVFFINTGVTFDLNALLDHPTTLALIPTFLILFVLVRGVPATLAAPPETPAGERLAIALFAATGLPIIVAVTSIGVDHGDLKTSTSAALIGAGMLSVLTLPLLALTLHRRHAPLEPSRRTFGDLAG
jgi:Kef-type K+ transport system membrane component KefB